MTKNKNNQTIWNTRIKNKTSNLIQKIGNSIDIDNENKIMKILDSLKDNRIIFLTSHKPSLIQKCDKK